MNPPLLFAVSLAALGIAASLPSPASARAVCGHQGQELVDEFDASSSVFIARIEGPATTLQPVASGTRGESGADVQMVISRVLKGPLRVGDRVTVRWQGWAEPTVGPRIGGCRVPATGTSERFPFEMLVLAQGEAGALTVRNDSSSERLGRVNRSFVRRMVRLARRRHARTRRR